MENNQNDYLLRAMSADASIRVFVASTKNTVQKAAEIHETTPVMSAALGRLMIGAVIMGAMLKNDEDLLTLTIKGDGEAGGLVVTANNAGQVKGYAFNPQADCPNKTNGKLDVSGVLGNGSLTVVKDLGLKEPYVGQVELVSGEIAEDLASYFVKSEQTPSAVSLGVLVDTDYSIRQSGGFVIQLLPFADDETIDKLENIIASIPPITTLLDSGKTPEDILDMLLGEFGYEITDKQPVEFFCNCSRERVEKALISLGKEEITKLIEEDGKAQLNCHFCNTSYDFTKEALIDLLKAAEQ